MTNANAPRVLYTNTTGRPYNVAVPEPLLPLNMGDRFPTSNSAPYRTVIVPVGYELWSDGSLRPAGAAPTPREPQHAPPHPPEENDMPRTATPPTPVTTVADAAATLTALQDALAAEADRQGYTAQFRTLIERAAAEIPGLRAVEKPLADATGNIYLNVRVTIPNGSGGTRRSTSRSTLTQRMASEVAQWAIDNGNSDLPRAGQWMAWLLAHPDRIDLAASAGDGYVDEYSIRTEPESLGRVEFVQ